MIFFEFFKKNIIPLFFKYCFIIIIFIYIYYELIEYKEIQNNLLHCLYLYMLKDFLKILSLFNSLNKFNFLVELFISIYFSNVLINNLDYDKNFYKEIDFYKFNYLIYYIFVFLFIFYFICYSFVSIEKKL